MAGIYIHIPFCRQACHYCNFHFSTSLALKNDFIRALVQEINMASGFIDPTTPIETIYFGGGTPSLLQHDELALIFEALKKKFNINPNAEITLEANPDDISRAVLDQWRQLGINRLSLGVQSFNEEELRWMNRAHNATESLASINEIQAAGFDNFSVDLIFGSPLLSNEGLENNLRIIFNKSIPHISCYALTVEPKTALNKLIEQKKSPAVDTEKQAEQFLLLMNAMRLNGYEHYEISNFAKPSMRSKHNSSYWQGKPYYGFGPSAHSFDGSNKRRWNVANNALYIQSIKNDIISFEEEVLTYEQRLNEYIMTSLRTIEGIDTGIVGLEFGTERSKQLQTSIQKFIDSGKAIMHDKKIMLTNEGKLFADGIAADLFF